MPVRSLYCKSISQLIIIPAHAVKAVRPSSVMKNIVPILDPRASAERSPYPMVVMDIILYQKLSMTDNSGSEPLSKRKNVMAFPEILTRRAAKTMATPNLRLRRTRFKLPLMLNIMRSYTQNTLLVNQYASGSWIR